MNSQQVFEDEVSDLDLATARIKVVQSALLEGKTPELMEEYNILRMSIKFHTLHTAKSA